MKPTYKQRFKINKKNKFHLMMQNDTAIMDREKFIKRKTK
jgi:hypothetical protein